MTTSLAGQRVTVMGLGLRAGGLGVAKYLVTQGAIVTVTDMKPESELRESIAALDGLPVRLVLGRHDDADFTRANADIVIRNPGVRRSSPYLQRAREAGVQVEMEMSLFLRACPAPVIGITGTKGKTTTAALCAEMLRAWDERTVLAGNMGVSAVAELERITASTPVVLELSSWQLEALDDHRLSPAIAVLTNISEDHLDAYAGFDDYASTKRTITAHQREDGWLVVNRDDDEAWRASISTAARIVPFGRDLRGADGMQTGEDRLTWHWKETHLSIPVPVRPPFLGEHQRMNAAAAAAAALLRGAPPDAIVAGLERFAGVANRMEIVAEIEGVTYINDTAATAPAAAVANLRGLAGRRVHLIAGGYDKGSNLEELAAAIAEHATSVRLLAGTASPALAELLSTRDRDSGEPHQSMASALADAVDHAVPGDVILLSPGCASFGLFRDEFDRGDRFKAAVSDLQLARVTS